ncbi:hypothetical protein LTR91_017422 [Friedmanniomyces endolithicus]|uniref:Uncharacterized protein n=1 Tax=Friedmanniomyces endolithicus TaxID=329885 RepID=A0AAN6QJK2_9PEZI|nr:hypothetical protein LTR75_000984 [Friedmanniomyces endolithicus]KAK0869366.1 hypothetical protein LTS02_003134 [Friedmanniomyces endolithicus]KAK0873627.1 hypothetical protein LTR87_011928 [Friedmanniomyces endolithicus]KAK0914600.1 hypothetical protein LTR02_001698 [Friedmanniomyces endolithicus]KAK0921046.1 hypothetical protein LTR57_009108 [Friedmanniomyces endolithicus]
MPSARRENYSTVEVRPDGATSKSNIALSSPGSPKAVRFAPSAKAEPRALLPIEAWSLYHLETHCRQCDDCYAPFHVRNLCAIGHGLASDLAEHVYRLDGKVYSRTKDNHKLVQVELPREYVHVAQLLKSMESVPRTTSRAAPVISYDRTYPAPARRITLDEEDDYREGTKVTIEPEPARTHSKTQSHSKHRSTRYRTVIVEDEDTAARTPVQKERRGSLYYDDMLRQRKEEYEVEIRQPHRKERRRDRERPVSGFWL